MKNNSPRIETSKKNAIYGVFLQFFTLLMSFVVRSIFIKTLGNEFLGLDSLFKNLLNLMSFTELGVGVAISSSLYEPLANNNTVLIKSLINLLKRFYNWIITIIIMAGMIMTVLLPLFINGSMPFGARLAFCLYFLNSAATYMLVVNRTLLIADQKSYINSVNQFVFLFMQYCIQIILLLVGSSYIIYLVAQLISTLLSNLSLSVTSHKIYPYLKDTDAGKLPPEFVRHLRENVIGMISAKFGGIILTSSDNLVLSIFVNLSTVGNYTNYTTVINGITTLLNTGINAITASVGNLGTEKDFGKERKTFFQLYWGNAILIMNISFGLYFFFGTFIRLWVGSQYQLSEMTTLAIIFLFFQNQLRQISITFQIAHSLFWQQRYKSLVEAGTNLAFSVAFVKIFGLGILGVVSGTIMSNLLINSWWEPLIVFKSAFHSRMKRYWLTYILVNFIFVICLLAIHLIKNLETAFFPLCLYYVFFCIIFNLTLFVTVPDFKKLLLKLFNR
ncbi:lipopolysaccharide biosynthesis protein [Secundilactobacillus collinoides]|uniref:Flippase n=1 Tax=Secundilactobacillus collinoides TaxID=33960 RepID=A0A166H622_SECCO|nr:oligosaccharide flippase family protein [Secundilactobacillus collinoides]KZL41497.1 flippase [Secundilactobacillus collinoides]